MNEHDRRHLIYIHESIERVHEYIGDATEMSNADFKTQDAVLRRLETLAESSRKLSDEIVRRHPEIPWRKVYGFRNFAAHAYLEIDLGLVTGIISDYLPALGKAIDEELDRDTDEHS